MSNLTKSIPADERKMLRKAFWRSFTLYAAVSPAKQGASGFCYSLMPFINKFYKNDEEGKKAALTRSMSYFNTTITLSTFIMGLVASMEKKNSEQKDFDASSINAVKSSLMGPLAGIGDSIFWGVLRVIAAGIAVGLGASGNVLAPIVFLLLFQHSVYSCEILRNIPGLQAWFRIHPEGLCKRSYEHPDKGCQHCRSDHGRRYDCQHGNL